MHLLSITIDADGSPSGHIAWYNYFTETSKIRTLRPLAKNDKYGIQRMEMLAIYFALSDNQQQIDKIVSSQSAKHFTINIRSDSKTTVEQLQGVSGIRDKVLQKIYVAIKKFSEKKNYTIINFNHLERTRNIAGLILEQRRRKEEEKLWVHQYHKDYYNRFMPYRLMTT